MSNEVDEKIRQQTMIRTTVNQSWLNVSPSGRDVIHFFWREKIEMNQIKNKCDLFYTFVRRFNQIILFIRLLLLIFMYIEINSYI